MADRPVGPPKSDRCLIGPIGLVGRRMADRLLLGQQATLVARLASGAYVDHASQLLKGRQDLIGY